MASEVYEQSASSESQPLLASHKTEDIPKDEIHPKPSWHIWPTFTTSAPRYRYVPLLGCIIIFINEAEYFFKQVASMRAIESMYCIEFYTLRDPDIAALGKHIPERLCKDNVIQKQVAKTAGFILFFRMLAALLGAVPLGQLADKKGRKIVLIMHKLNVFAGNSLWLLICEQRQR